MTEVYEFSEYDKLLSKAADEISIFERPSLNTSKELMEAVRRLALTVEQQDRVIAKEKRTAMNQQETNQLSEQMAIETMVDDMRDLFIVTAESRPRAISMLAEGRQKALEVKHRMLQALLALDTLGYEIRKK